MSVIHGKVLKMIKKRTKVSNVSVQYKMGFVRTERIMIPHSILFMRSDR